MNNPQKNKNRTAVVVPIFKTQMQILALPANLTKTYRQGFAELEKLWAEIQEVNQILHTLQQRYIEKSAIVLRRIKEDNHGQIMGKSNENQRAKREN